MRALLNQPLVFPEPPANPADPNQVFAATAQDRERLAEFSPAHYLTSDDPPTKLYHAYLDPTVPYLQSLGLLNRNAQGAFIAMDLVVHDPAADCPTSKCYHGAGRFDSGYYDFDNTEFARVYVTDLPDSANRVPRGQLVFDAVTRSSSASSVIDPDSPATPLRIQYVLHAPLGSGGERSGPPTQTSDAHRHDIPAVPALAPSDGGTSTRVYLYALDPFTGAEKLVASTVVTASNAPRAQLVFDHATRRIRASAVIDPAAPQTQLQIQFVLHAPLGQPGSETFGPLFNTGVDHSFESPVPTDLPITGSGLTRVYLYAKIGSSLVLVSSAVIPQP